MRTCVFDPLGGFHIDLAQITSIVSVPHYYNTHANTDRFEGEIYVGATEDNVRAKLANQDEGLARSIHSSGDHWDRHTAVRRRFTEMATNVPTLI